MLDFSFKVVLPNNIFGIMGKMIKLQIIQSIIKVSKDIFAENETIPNRIPIKSDNHKIFDLIIL